MFVFPLKKASVFPQHALCTMHPDLPLLSLLLTYKKWEQNQLFQKNHTITQTMRKNANMVLRCMSGNGCHPDDI